jgi:hypothetical protein
LVVTRTELIAEEAVLFGGAMVRSGVGGGKWVGK